MWATRCISIHIQYTLIPFAFFACNPASTWLLQQGSISPLDKQGQCCQQDTTCNKDKEEEDILHPKWGCLSHSNIRVAGAGILRHPQLQPLVSCVSQQAGEVELCIVVSYQRGQLRVFLWCTSSSLRWDLVNRKS